jgi:hypothetical protein
LIVVRQIGRPAKKSNRQSRARAHTVGFAVRHRQRTAKRFSKNKKNLATALPLLLQATAETAGKPW